MHISRSFTDSESDEVPHNDAQRPAAHFRRSIANNNHRKGGVS